MATIAKFYFHDAATTNIGTMPSGILLADNAGTTATTGDAAGARTARSTSAVAGVANPDTESTFTSNAVTTQQFWGHRRFVSAPLAAQTLASADGVWNFSAAYTESNLNHNLQLGITVYAWDPVGGVRRGSGTQALFVTLPEPTVAATEEAHSNNSQSWPTNLTISNGDILVFDVTSVFTQGMATAYTEQFAYDGTTEASTITCATFITPPVALTLFTANIPSLVADTHRVSRNSNLRRCIGRAWDKRPSGIFVPSYV